MILKSEEIPGIVRMVRIACRNKGRLIRWEIHAEGESSFVRVFYAVRFAAHGEERSFGLPCRFSQG